MHFLVLLAAGLALAGPPTPPVPLEVPFGAAEIPLQVSLQVCTGGGTCAHTGVKPLVWQTLPDGTLQGYAASEEWEAKVALAPAVGGARALELALEWRAAAEVERIALALEWAGAPAAVTRALRLEPVDGPVRVERGTPLLVAAGDLVLAGGPGLAAARVERTAERTRTTLFLDDAAARPFSTFETCFDKLPVDGDGLQHISWGTFDPRRPHPLAPRAAGDVDRASATLYPRAGGSGFLPVVVERWPAGARAAVVFTDHADRTDPAALRAVLWGDSAAGPGAGAGFLGHGLRLTRTFFVHGHRGTLDDPAARTLAEELVAAGSEVALHSITAERDGREEVRAGLAAASGFSPATWIDHEPYTNCEALSAQGWQAGGRFGIRDVLAEGGIRWVWAAGDCGSGAPRVLDLLGGPVDEARAAVFPFPFDPRLWVFRSSMFYATPADLAAALSAPVLGELERARGLFVAHTYLGPSAATTHTRDHLARLAVHETGGGRLVIDPALDAALAQVAEEVQAGRLASLTWAQAGDRLRALGDVEVAYLPDGAAELRNHGDAAVDGLTLHVPVPPTVELELDGAVPLVREDADGGARIWFDLPAGGRAVLRASERLAPVPFLEYP